MIQIGIRYPGHHVERRCGGAYEEVHPVIKSTDLNALAAIYGDGEGPLENYRRGRRRWWKRLIEFMTQK